MIKKLLNLFLRNSIWKSIAPISTGLAIIIAVSLPQQSLSQAKGNTQSSGYISIPFVTIYVDEENTIHRNVIQNEEDWKLTWVIQHNGEVVLERNALSETKYRYFRNEPGLYTVYIKGWVGKRYQPLSNIVSYEIRSQQNLSQKKRKIQSSGNNSAPFLTIYVDETNAIHRNVIQNEEDWKLTWVIQHNGEVVLERNALSETKYRYFRKEPGLYTVYIKGWVGKRYQPLSNIVSYEIR